ncbi:phage tail protein [Enterobacteriaceae bacterium ENNIH1]|nr:phage tail protein [Enterobacteriaceae bacterium ENNIH1]
MAAKFFALLTARGSVKLASATALGTQLKLTHLAVGDGNGTLPTPTASQTALINERRRAAINSLTVDPLNPSQIIAEQVIPEDEGGFWIREIGVFDDAGELIAIANCAETYKPVLAEGSGRTQVIRMVLIVSSTDAVTLKIDPSVVLATRKYADDQTIIVKAYADDLLAKHLAAADPHPQYAPKASPTLTGTPTAPTAALSANNTQLATTAFVKAAIAALVASSPAALDTLNELAAALGNDPNFATTMTNALAGKQPLDNTLTALSGKSVAALLEYLGLGAIAGLGTPTGALASGIIRIPMYNGTTVETLILQWMAAPALAAGGNATITFPTAFPNALLSLMATGGATAAGVPGINTFSIGATSCRIYNQSTSASTQAGAIWALGK